MASTTRPWPSSIGSAAPIVLFDGVCNLCNGLVRFLIQRDKPGRLRLASLQSNAGQALLHWANQPLDDFDTMVLIEQGRPYFKSTAVLKIARHLPWPWPLLSLALFVPRILRDFCYDIIATNRYRIFGRTETCMLPTADIRAPLL